MIGMHVHCSHDCNRSLRHVHVLHVQGRFAEDHILLSMLAVDLGDVELDQAQFGED